MSDTTETRPAARDPRIADPAIVAKKKELQKMIKEENGGKPPA